MCLMHSAVFRILEKSDREPTVHHTCSFCTQYRVVLWERFEMKVKIEPLTDQSSYEVGDQ